MTKRKIEREKGKRSEWKEELLQCCHSHCCILRMPGQSELEEVEQRKEGWGKLLQLYLSHSVKVGQQTHTKLLSSTCVWARIKALGEVGSWRNLAFLQGHMKTSREAEDRHGVFDMDCLTHLRCASIVNPIRLVNTPSMRTFDSFHFATLCCTQGQRNQYFQGLIKGPDIIK